MNPLFLIFHEVDGHIEESIGNKYFTFASTDKNKEVLTKYAELWDKLKNLLAKINGKPGENEKGYTKIKFHCDDDVPFGKN